MYSESGLNESVYKIHVTHAVRDTVAGDPQGGGSDLGVQRLPLVLCICCYCLGYLMHVMLLIFVRCSLVSLLFYCFRVFSV